MKFKIVRFKKVKSTNDTAIRILRNSKLNYGMIIAETQSKGRGQYGRKWISLKGNLFVSFFYSLENLNLTFLHHGIGFGPKPKQTLSYYKTDNRWQNLFE